MELVKELNSEELTLKVIGRLDTNTSPVLDEELKTIDDSVKVVVLDFSSLEYVSSSGLRIILSLQKKMMGKGKLVIRSVNDTVKNIFDITGFSSILTIE